MAPVADLLPSDQSANTLGDIPAPLLQQMRSAASRWRDSGGESRIGRAAMAGPERVVPPDLSHLQRKANITTT